jgi:hypothetical protein
MIRALVAEAVARAAARMAAESVAHSSVLVEVNDADAERAGLPWDSD